MQVFFSAGAKQNGHCVVGCFQTTTLFLFALFQLVMEYCLGSASDLLEGTRKQNIYWDFAAFSVYHFCKCNNSLHSPQETPPRGGNSCHYPRCFAGTGLPSLSQHDSQVNLTSLQPTRSPRPHFVKRHKRFW